MKKITASVLACAMTLGIGGTFAACGEKTFDENKNVTVVAREDGSGTKSAFMEIIGLKGKADVSGALPLTSTAAVLQEIKGNFYAIGYDSLGYVTNDVKMLKVDGVDATVENIKNGSYAIARPLSVVYKESNVASGVNAAFLAYLESADAQEIISQNGYVSMNDNGATYVVEPPLSGTIDISGSTSLQPLMLLLADEFEKLQPNVTVNVAGGGSGTGYSNANSEVSDFGMISEEFNASKADKCVSAVVAKDGIAVIVNKANPLDSISMTDLKNIYNSEAGDERIKTWSQIAK